MEFINLKTPLNTNDFLAGQKFLFGPITITENEIIEFAKLYDPLPFHINKEEAKKSVFKNIVASGSQIFTMFYKDKVIPIIGHTILAGLEINNWKFLLPVFPDTPYIPLLTILDVKFNSIKKHAVVKWLYEFKTSKNELVQSLEIISLHKII
jgi:acyl dehydratase